MRTILFLVASLCSAQTLMINAGGSAVGQFDADQGFKGGAAYGPLSQPDPGWKAQPGIYSTLRYGTAFAYDFAVPNGSCAVQLNLIENRPAVATASVPAAAIGARVFTVTVNGVSSGPIDIFAAVGAQFPYSPPAIMAPVVNGHLHLDFKATAGNATVSSIGAWCTGPVISVMKCSKPAVPSTPATNTDGTPAKNADGTPAMIPGSDCAGLYYVDLITAAGAEITIMGVAPIAPIDTTAWSLVP